MRSLLARLADSLAEPWVDESPAEEHPYQSHDPGSSAGARFMQGMALSAAAHAALLAVLGYQFVSPPPERPPEPLLLTTSEEQEELVLPDLDYQMAEASDDPAKTALSALAMSVAPTFNREAALRGVLTVADLPAAITAPAPELQLEGVELDERLLSAGSLGEQVLEVDGAVDRITEEIMTNLESSKVLVVWIMDASISLKADRQAAADRLERIYRELDELGAGDGPDGALKSAVVAFGQQAKELAPAGSETREIISAIRNVPIDESGIENVFQTVTWCSMRYQRQRQAEHRREIFVIWTDESGNDYDHLEDAVNFCRNNVIPVYVVGPSSMFGKERGTVAYKHTDGKVYNLPIDRGPDSVRDERLNLPYWFEGSQYESLHAGLSPFALTRLVNETGGAYFIMDHAADRSPFAIDVMHRYVPEYDPPAAYVREALASPVRRAVLAAVDITKQRKLKGTPRLSFAPTGKTFFNELREAQETVAYNAPTIQQALSAFDSRKLEEAYAKEPSPRWRAWYDLTYGRLLAMYVRCNEYNWACAVMKGKGADFVDQKSNRWQFRPDPATHFGSQSEKMSKEATRLLSRCVHENPGTPWALLAQRELAQPLGFKVVEAYVAPPPPPPKPKPGAAKPAPPPPPPPPSNARRREEARKLPRPVEVPLPKL